jgi:hypothetical protein
VHALMDSSPQVEGEGCHGSQAQQHESPAQLTTEHCHNSKHGWRCHLSPTQQLSVNMPLHWKWENHNCWPACTELISNVSRNQHLLSFAPCTWTASHLVQDVIPGLRTGVITREPERRLSLAWQRAAGT